MPAEPERIQLLLGQVIRDRGLRERLEREPEQVLRERGIEGEDAQLLLDVGVQRLIAYHEMVHSRLFKTVKAFMGGAATRLGDARLRADLRRWMRTLGPRSQYLREVPEEFLAWARPQWEEDPSLPPWLAELAAHQVLIRTLRNTPVRVAPASAHKIDLERPVLCNATARVLRYRYAVHRLPRKLPAELEPEPLEPGHAVVAFRSAEDRPRFVDIKPRSAAMLERLLAGQTLREALFGACEAMGETLDDEILSVTAVTLADLCERHVLLGGAG